VDPQKQAAMDMFLTMTAKDFNPEDYQSQFETRLRELLATKTAEDQVTLTRTSSGTTAAPAVDFTEALNASIAALQLVGGTDTEPAKKPAKKRAKKAAAPAADVA
jgi:non-homologous end joining protein Ku